MTISAHDLDQLRSLAGRYSDIAHQGIQHERLERYRRSNDLEIVRPIVLINEVPWGEIDDDALRCTTARELHWVEWPIRAALYQWEHFQVDLVLPPEFRVRKAIRGTGIGMHVVEETIHGDTGAYISSHEYTDQLQSEDDLRKLRVPEVACDQEATERRLETAQAVFDGLLPVRSQGVCFQYNIWDVISCLRGVDALLLDLALRPDFMHQVARAFTDIAAATFRQYEDLGLLEPDLVLLHCTPACSGTLPAADFAGTARPRDIWGRCAAQIFSAVSPEMHDEFDLAYNQELFGGCGLLYYGCCEPMDTKIDILRRRFSNLRKVSITPWADPRRAAEAMGPDLVLAAKPNPAFVSQTTFDPAPVAAEIAEYCEACRDNGTPLEFVIKDISTIANDPRNLALWAETVNRTIDRYYG